MENLKEKFNRFLDDEIKRCAGREQALILEERKDEANLCKVEANIYEIFGVLMDTAVKEVQKEQPDRALEKNLVLEKFYQKADTVPQNWHISYQKAKEHGDSERLLVEETKLATVDKIMLVLENIKEGEN